MLVRVRNWIAVVIVAGIGVSACDAEVIPASVTILDDGGDLPQGRIGDEVVETSERQDVRSETNGDAAVDVSVTPSEAATETADARDAASDLSVDGARPDVVALPDAPASDADASDGDVFDADAGQRADADAGQRADADARVDADASGSADGDAGLITDADAGSTAADGPGAEGAPPADVLGADADAHDDAIEASADRSDGAVADGAVAAPLGWQLSPDLVCTTSSGNTFCGDNPGFGYFMAGAASDDCTGGTGSVSSQAQLWFPTGAALVAGDYLVLPASGNGDTTNVPSGRVVVAILSDVDMWWAQSGAVHVRLTSGQSDITFDGLNVTLGSATGSTSGHIICP